MELKFIFNKTLHLIRMKINGKRLFGLMGVDGMVVYVYRYICAALYGIIIYTDNVN